MGSSKFGLAALLLVASLAATVVADGTTLPHRPSRPPLATCKVVVPTEVIAKGHLTVATNTPALAPWFWNDNPGNGKGYESAVAYALAGVLGLKRSSVAWYTEPF